MTKRKFLLTLLCCMGTILFPLSTSAVSYSGYVGDQFELKQPSVSILAKKIKSVTWSGTYADGISCYEMSGYLRVIITSYFESLITINCDVAYEWESNGGTYTGHARESYSIRCNPVEINVSNPNMTMKVGQKQYINYSLSPSKPAKLTFRSDNSSVATVDDLGEVTAVGVGSARITIDQNMGFSEYCNVTVTEPVAPTSISLPSEKAVDVYSTTMLYPTILPTEANPTLTWTSDDTSIASVDQNGKVTGVNPGTTTITVKTDNDLSASCAITVKDVDRTPKQFSFDQEKPQKTIYEGQSYWVKYQVYPDYAKYTLTWTSSDESVATVYGGYVTAKKQGKARITATVDGSTLTDYCDITVKGIPNVLTVWFANGQRTDIKLSENLKVTSENEVFIVKGTTVDVQFDAIDVFKFTLENDGSEGTGIQAVTDGKTAEGTMSYDGNVILLTGFTPGSAVHIFAVNGQIESSYRIGHDGNLTIGLDGLTRGIHIVKTESITYKIIKK